MSQLYAPHETMLICTSGVKMSRINVTKQSTVTIAGQKLAGTYVDKMYDNFNCVWLRTIGAVLGVICVMPFALSVCLAGATIGCLVGGLVGGVGGLVMGAKKGYSDAKKEGKGFFGRVGGSFKGALVGGTIGKIGGGLLGAQLGGGFLFSAGAFAGSLINRIPCICSFLTESKWKLYHPTVRIHGKFALVENSTLKCMLPGVVMIKILNLRRAIQCAILSWDIYDLPDHHPSKQKLDGLKEEFGLANAIVDNNDLPVSLQIKKDGTNPLINEDSGFMGRIYNIEENGETIKVLVFKGTDNERQPIPDWKTNGIQSFGLESDQYQQAAKTSEIFAEEYENENLCITGHSKAGGEATLGGAITGVDTYAYNSAGVHDKTFERNGVTREKAKHVLSFHAEGKDILNTLQDNKSSIAAMPGLGTLLLLTNALPPSSGDRIGMETNAPSILAEGAEGHSMEYLIDALKKELKNSPTNTVREINF